MFKKFFNTKTIIFMILAIGLLLLMPKLIGLFMILFASYVLAAALNPFVNKLELKFKNRAASASVVVISAIVALFALILPIIVMCYKEVELFISLMPQKAMNLYNFVTHSKLYGHTISDLIPMEQLADASSNIAQNVLNQSVNFTMALAQMLFFALALTMFIYYILVDKSYLRGKFIEFFPPALKEKASCILHNITSKVGNYVRAQVISMIAVGLMITLVVAVLGIDYPILLGLIAGILDIIPLLGPTIALAVIVAVAFPLGITKIILACILFLAAQQVSNYVIRPFLFGRFMKLHPITILVAIFVAQEFLGVWGVILSPAIAATLCVLVDELYLTPINEIESGTTGE
ncbi:MAG: AI-2E family transporter [Muribaculaceae bacterium]|nr:AI-2E family transporter [Muribaculaceae bacterium]